ncbi:MAG TPA: biotin/lipoyl-binding protein [Spirochaetales bacterium]|nr:biotin/lipoyl-binding protein [Spirochaetales bacterium]
MKKYRVTVNGQSYDVGVEELGAAPSFAAPAAAAAPVPAAAPAAPAAPAPSAGPAVAGATTVKAPMPGTVMSFKAIVGQHVKRGDVLLILEAMKMENEIVAPADGTVASIRVPQGAAVNTGDALVDLS